MSTLSECIHEVADSLYRPVATVNTRAQKLRRERLVPVEGRGLSAAHLDSHHLVRLLLAAMLPDVRLVHVVKSVKRLEKLKLDSDSMQDVHGLLSKNLIDAAFPELGRVRNLRDVLVTILEFVRFGETIESPVLGVEEFSFHIRDRILEATVRIFAVDNPDAQISLTFGGESKKRATESPLTTSVTVSGQVFERLAMLLPTKGDATA